MSEDQKKWNIDICKLLKTNKLNIGVIALTILIIPILHFSHCISLQTKLLPITIQESMVDKAQVEMGILSNFLMSNAQIIIWIRGIFFTIWMAIIGFVLKTYYIDGKSYKINPHKCLLRILLLIIFLIAFVLELTIQGQQVLLTNRVSQLDYAINEVLLDPPEFANFQNQSDIDKLQKVFEAKNKIESPKNVCGCKSALLIWNAIKAPTFFIFYLVMLIFWLIFSCLLIDP